MILFRQYAILALFLSGILAVPSAMTQQTAIHKIELQDESFPLPNRTLMIKAIIDQGGEVALHVHPGIEMGYILDGRATMHIDGHPTRTLSTGDSFAVPPRTVHGLKNIGSGPLIVISTYVVAADQPISKPAPEAKR